MKVPTGLPRALTFPPEPGRLPKAALHFLFSLFQHQKKRRTRRLAVYHLSTFHKEERYFCP